MNRMFSYFHKSLGAVCLLGSLSMAEATLAQSFTFDTDDRVTTISNLTIGTGTFDVTFNPTQSFDDLFGDGVFPILPLSSIPTFFNDTLNSITGTGLAFADAEEAAQAIQLALNLPDASPSGVSNSGETAGAAGDGFSIPESFLGTIIYQIDTNALVGTDSIREQPDSTFTAFPSFPIVTFTPSTATSVPEGSTVLGTILGLLLGGGLWFRHQKHQASGK